MLKRFINLLLIAQISLSGLFFINPAANNNAAQADHNTMCSQPADLVLLMDRSGSMDYTSRCDWWQLKCLNSPSCSLGYAWVKNTNYNQTEFWCTAKNKPAPHQSAYSAFSPKKITAAKLAADSFLNLNGTGDQSALISYANTASLDKNLSNNHATTQTAVNGLIAGGATNIGDAIKLGIQELKSARANPQANKVMILLTDGMANKPNGPGFGEFPADVAYAESQAILASSHGFKIFTIGLGDNEEINQTMLKNIASTTGAQYYHAPAQNDLQIIYSSIATRLCRFGSISGCKYSDTNKDGVILGEEKIVGWEIILNNDDTVTQLTNQGGCFKFSGLLPGDYILSENGKAGVIFEQTYPAAGSYAIDLAEGENLENYDFGNYLPVCGNQILDADFGEVCELGQTQSCAALSGYAGTKSCLANCAGWSDCQPTEFCGDGLVNDGEQCDGAAGVGPNQICSQTCALTDLPHCGDGIINGQEECDDGNANNNDQCKNNCSLPGCKSAADVMMVLDRSGSMDYTSRCDWWQLKCLNSPSCSLGYAWVKNTNYNQTESWCAAKNKPAPHESFYLPIDPIKITAAKIAANNFINLLEANDQSGLVSYANSAAIDKQLSNNHATTQTAINALAASGATDIGDAIKLGAAELLSPRNNPQANKVMILLTDGMANKPNGPGFGEFPADVAYAKAEAGLAADAGIRIFTIGLGEDGEIDEIMLQDIAANSGGQYYHAPAASQLEEIFNQLADDTCH